MLTTANKALGSLKAIAALVGSLLTAVAALNPTHVPTWAAYVLAICTAVGAWTVPNTLSLGGVTVNADQPETPSDATDSLSSPLDGKPAAGS